MQPGTHAAAAGQNCLPHGCNKGSQEYQEPSDCDWTHISHSFSQSICYTGIIGLSRNENWKSLRRLNMIAQSKDQQLIDRWIELAPDADPAEAQLVYYGTPVWALIGYLPAAANNVAQAADDYGIPRDAASAALAYYELHREAINARLAANVI
jgi:uncharacterized protein (DUF433 family)